MRDGASVFQLTVLARLPWKRLKITTQYRDKAGLRDECPIPCQLVNFVFKSRLLYSLAIEVIPYLQLRFKIYAPYYVKLCDLFVKTTYQTKAKTTISTVLATAMGGSPGEVCDVGEATESLENEL